MILADHPIFLVAAIAVVAPLLAEIPVVGRVPVVVLEVLCGILVGPYVLAWVDPGNTFLQMMKVGGLAAVLFMAGMEVDFEQIRGRPLALALRGWVVSAGLAFVAVGLLHLIPGVHAPMMVTIALTTTGLGTLLPVLRDSGRLDTPFGRQLLAAGTIAEIAPIVAVSLALSERYSSWQEFGFLIAFLALIALAAAVGAGARPPKVLALLSRTLHSSTQLPVRLALLLLLGSFVLAHELGFEGILGAFAIGMVVGLATRGEKGEPFRVKIDAVCFGWFAPFFFVGTGLHFALGTLTQSVTTMLLIPSFLVLFLVVRGVPALLYRKDLATPEQAPFALCSGVASLGLVVVIVEIGLRAQNMNSDVAQALVAAALLSLLVYPTLAGILLSRVGTPATETRIA